MPARVGLTGGVASGKSTVSAILAELGLGPRAIAAALLWLVTDERARELSRSATMIDLQDLVREHGLAG